MQAELLLAVKEDGTIENNVDTFVEETTKALNKYNYVVTEDNQKDVKDDMATLNKLVKAIKDRRIGFEKELLASWEPSKKKLMDLEKEALKYRTDLDNGVNVFEDNRKNEKKSEIEQYFETKEFTLLPLERLFDERWLNATFKEKQWKEDLDSKIDKINKDIEFVDLMQGDEEYRVLVKSYYLETMDIGEAKSKADIQEARRKEFEASKKVEEPVVEEVVQPIIETVDHAQEMNEEINQELEQDTTRIVTLQFKVNDEKARKLTAFLKENDIPFKKVEE